MKYYIVLYVLKKLQIKNLIQQTAKYCNNISKQNPK